MPPARLITIPLSHYCEKARWILDATGIEYQEEGHVPVAHLRATRAVGGRTVPVLVHGREVLRDSSEIARYAEALAPPDRRLVPEDDAARARVLALEDELDETLGVDARLLVYWHNLSDDVRARALVARMAGLRRPLAARVFAPLFRGLVFRKYKVNEETAKLAEARVRSTFARLGDVSSDGYLVGDRFTLADLTLASLASLLLSPPEHPIMGRRPAPPHRVLSALRDDVLATPAGRHALRVYRDHRAAKVATDSPGNVTARGSR